MSEPTFEKPLQPPFSAEKLATVNVHLRSLEPQQILAWALEYLPGLYQTTAFGLTGLVAIDMLSKLVEPDSRPPLIFIDTLYHFRETHELISEVEELPEDCKTVEDFEKKWGERLWEQYEDIYDYVVKVEPGRRAYEQLKVQSVITGRRASQGGERASLQPLEVDSTGLLKLNPLFAWPFAQVEQYIKENNVPRNKLLDQGYRSVGDWHSTLKSGEGDAGERAGRWAGKENKTECGLHKDYFDMQRKAGQLEATTLEAGNSTCV
ncbi:Phosphoadenosine phosphosulfate reductase family-domain-containing protein [Pisolithus microcarpus]|nr:Phosphoadenosine phosphosulfate reductase family-domain-containing protein [Pisolithus microcarpus]